MNKVKAEGHATTKGAAYNQFPRLVARLLVGYEEDRGDQPRVRQHQQFYFSQHTSALLQEGPARFELAPSLSALPRALRLLCWLRYLLGRVLGWRGAYRQRNPQEYHKEENVLGLHGGQRNELFMRYRQKQLSLFLLGCAFCRCKKPYVPS